MMHKIFTVYDEKAHAHMPPFFLPELGMAVRVFTDCCNDAEHKFGKHPHDYTLKLIGTYDDATASITQDTKTIIGNGAEYIDRQPNKNDQLALLEDTNEPLGP